MSLQPIITALGLSLLARMEKVTVPYQVQELVISLRLLQIDEQAQIRVGAFVAQKVASV